MSRILLVDDNESFRKMLQKTLERAGYQVQDAADGNAALRLYRQQSADLIITDLVMPEKEGLETIMEVRRINPTVKIIAMSGGGRGGPRGYLTLAQRLGAARTLTKPFSHEELLDAITELLGDTAKVESLAGTPPPMQT